MRSPRTGSVRVLIKDYNGTIYSKANAEVVRSFQFRWDNEFLSRMRQLVTVNAPKIHLH